ncbi:hypothetical protein Ae717Ps2_5818 [Pseudonocardia sp. Ae717_Ps2]|nr:hypothetical protein Ae717Ps2_5818 [Pseudonocardia sp. Ae717_Ps2]
MDAVRMRWGCGPQRRATREEGDMRSWVVVQTFDVSDAAAEALAVPLRQALRAEQAGAVGRVVEDHDVVAGASVRAEIGRALAVMVAVTAGDRRRGRVHGRRVLRAAFQAAAQAPWGPLAQVAAVERAEAAEQLYTRTVDRLVVAETAPGPLRQMLKQQLGVDLIRGGFL